MQFDEFLSVLDLLKNPAQYEAQIADLTARNQAIQDSIAQMGVVGDVVKAQTKANQLFAAAQEAIVAANRQAEQLVAGAQTAFDTRNQAIQEREVAADQILANYNGLKASSAAREADLRAAEKAVAAAQAQIAATQADLQVKQTEVDQRLLKLREAMV